LKTWTFLTLRRREKVQQVQNQVHAGRFNRNGKKQHGFDSKNAFRHLQGYHQKALHITRQQKIQAQCRCPHLLKGHVIRTGTPVARMLALFQNRCGMLLILDAIF